MKFVSHNWSDYALIDCGGGKKLERFGKHILVRPEVHADWPPNLPAAQWAEMRMASFRQKGSRSGEWNLFEEMPSSWMVKVDVGSQSLRFKLGLTQFKHVGLFPEQINNWNFIAEKCSAKAGSKVLNLFAYTGAASVVASAHGAAVTNVDSIKQVTSWAKDNAELNGRDNIRWLVDDALKFARKEARRGNTYDGIIMDPPSYGHGPKGERWKIEDKIEELISVTAQILENDGWLILNTYSGLDESFVLGLLQNSFGNCPVEHGPLVLVSEQGNELETGSLFRINRT